MGGKTNNAIMLIFVASVRPLAIFRMISKWAEKRERQLTPLHATLLIVTDWPLDSNRFSGCEYNKTMTIKWWALHRWITYLTKFKPNFKYTLSSRRLSFHRAYESQIVTLFHSVLVWWETIDTCAIMMCRNNHISFETLLLPSRMRKLKMSLSLLALWFFRGGGGGLVGGAIYKCII